MREVEMPDDPSEWDESVEETLRERFFRNGHPFHAELNRETHDISGALQYEVWFPSFQATFQDVRDVDHTEYGWVCMVSVQHYNVSSHRDTLEDAVKWVQGRVIDLFGRDLDVFAKDVEDVVRAQLEE